VLLRFTEEQKGQRVVVLSQRKLGETVGASRESVNKCLAQWQRAGVLEIADGAIKIKDVEALEAVAAELE
jgi:hypothetical protein